MLESVLYLDIVNLLSTVLSQNISSFGYQGSALFTQPCLFMGVTCLVSVVENKSAAIFTNWPREVRSIKLYNYCKQRRGSCFPHRMGTDYPRPPS